MRKLLLCALVIWAASRQAAAQLPLDIRNYSTSFAGVDADKDHPFLVTAIPYAGNYLFQVDHSDSMDLDHPPRRSSVRELNTFDSSDAYFFAPGVYAGNAGQYEFRVLLDARRTVVPWSPIRSFTTDSMEVGGFTSKHHYGFLGGYRTTWDHYLVVDLRRKGSDSLLSTSAVYWSQTRPVLLNMYTSADLGGLLNEVIRKINAPTGVYFDSTQMRKWATLYPAEQRDSVSGLPKKLRLRPGENNIVFYINAGIYEATALEYALFKDNTQAIPWHANEFDHNFITLHDLIPGGYVLKIRYRAQRQNVTIYPFLIRPTWSQTIWFKVGIALVIILFVALTAILIRLRQKSVTDRYRRDSLNMELKSIRSQLNPHFIFNSLASIQGLINKNDIANANRYLSEFGNLMRDSLKGSRKDVIPLETEIHILDTYLKLEQLRFPFTYRIQTADDLPVQDLEVPSLLLQPLVENAVKHGVSPLQEKGLIEIRFDKQNANFTCVIRDNGKGFAAGRPGAEGARPAAGSPGETKGYGLSLTRERIALLNEVLQGQSIRMEIDSAEGWGTKVLLTFENWIQ